MGRCFALLVIGVVSDSVAGCTHSSCALEEPSRWAARFKRVLKSPHVLRECQKRRVLPRELRLTRWPALNGTRIGVSPHWHYWMGNVENVEPLAMAAFVGAIRSRQRSNGWIIDIGANMGAYSLVGAAIAPNLSTLSVDMQPRCVQATRCHLALNGLLDRAIVINGYVSGNASAPPIDVPLDSCDSMASPSAVGGRRPNGANRANQNAIVQGRFNRSLLWPVRAFWPSQLLRQRLQPGERIAIVKIDTEGFEPSILQALRPLWPLIDDLVVELQPSAWRLHHIDVETAIATFRELLVSNQLRAVTLPHPQWKEMGLRLMVSYDLVDVCKLPRRAGPVKGLGWLPHAQGLRKAEVYDADGLEAMIREILEKAPGSFHEVLLTRRRCS
jgi:FkbM family methyltransferase